jgi:sugar lactone lactonase YvrE
MSGNTAKAFFNTDEYRVGLYLMRRLMSEQINHDPGPVKLKEQPLYRLVSTVWRQCYQSLAAAIIALVSVLIVPCPGLAQSTNTTADRVLGQIDFTHNGANVVTAQGLNAVAAVAIDRSATPNHIYVADSGNNRVLGWSNAAGFVSGQAADLEIGQPDFASAVCSFGGVNSQTLCNPTAVAVDSAGNLYVADTGNNRALEYNSPYSHMAVAGVGHNAANQVFGQSNFGASGCTAPVSAETLCGAAAVAVDPANNLYIADSQNNRTLEYNTPLALTSVSGSGDNIADLVFGQPGMTSAGCNLGSNAISASSLCQPSGVAADGSGNVYISDTQNNRVLEYNGPAISRNIVADMVLGQNSFSSQTCDSGGTPARPGPSSLCTPRGIATDPAGDLYVADNGNSRVLEYHTPLSVTSTPGSGDTIADLVFGQSGSFTTTLCNLPGSANPMPGTGTAATAATLCGAQGIAADSQGNVYVADTNNGRVLRYNTPLTVTNVSGSGDTVADEVLGKPDLLHGGPDIVSPQGLNFPLSVTIDTTVVPNHIYVADSSNNRVLGWKNESNFANGAAADLVFGQPDFVSSATNSGGSVKATTLNFPEGLTVDAAGNLWIGDTNNSRILEFNTPYLQTSVPGSGDTIPDFVLGQSNYTTGGCNGPITSVTQPPPNNSFCQAIDVAVDNAGNVYGSDANNNRILEWNKPLTTGNTTPDMVFGQPNFTSGECNSAGRGSPPTSTTLCSPEGVAVDNVGNFYLNDNLNNRLLEFNQPAVTGNITPALVFGQPNFISSGCSPGAGGLCQPRAAVLDAAGNLYISDSAHNRVVEFNTPVKTGNSNADLVFGQLGVFNTGACDGVLGTGPNANNLCLPSGVSLDSSGNLFVADARNNRVLEFNQPLGSTGTPTPTPTPSPTPTPTPTPTPAVTPAVLSQFGPQPVGTTSPAVNFTLTNYQNVPLTAINVIVGGLNSNAGDFSQTNNCGTSLAVGGSCTISVKFTPSARGYRWATLGVVDSASNSAQTILLAGAGS